eukprot:271569-Pyramimonas_sp.AAC.1
MPTKSGTRVASQKRTLCRRLASLSIPPVQWLMQMRRAGADLRGLLGALRQEPVGAPSPLQRRGA